MYIYFAFPKWQAKQYDKPNLDADKKALKEKPEPQISGTGLTLILSIPPKGGKLCFAEMLSKTDE